MAVTIKVLVDSSELVHVKDAADQAGDVDLQIQPRTQALDPITAVLIGGAVLAVAKFVVDAIDRFKGGVTIDLSAGGAPVVRRDPNVPYGWAVVIAKDGAVQIEVRDAPKDAAERLLSQIIEGVLKNAQEIGDAAKASLGNDRVKGGVA